MGGLARCEMLHILQSVWSYPIIAFTEFRHAFRISNLVPLPPPLGMHHSFVVLELEGSNTEICLERFDDSLEMMIGDRRVLRHCAKCCRATGESRPVDGERPVEELQRFKLGFWVGLPVVRVGDLYAWIKGPLAMSWQLNEPSTASWQHFVGELQQFLRNGKNEVLSYPQYVRPPKAS